MVARDLHAGYGATEVLAGVDLAIPEGTITVLVGPNGSGKTTLLRVMARILKPKGGVVLLDGLDIASQPTRQVAVRVGVLPQSPIAPPTFTVADLVEQGRFPHVGILGRMSSRDADIVRWAVEITGLSGMEDRPLDHLSGGERQRAWIALALAQQTQILLLDEPTTFLDLRHQLEVLDLIATLNRDLGLTVVAVLHDLNHALRLGHRIAVMSEGAVAAIGAPNDVIEPGLVGRVFGVAISMVKDPNSGRTVCVLGTPLDRKEN